MSSRELSNSYSLSPSCSGGSSFNEQFNGFKRSLSNGKSPNIQKITSFTEKIKNKLNQTRESFQRGTKNKQSKKLFISQFTNYVYTNCSTCSEDKLYTEMKNILKGEGISYSGTIPKLDDVKYMLGTIKYYAQSRSEIELIVKELADLIFIEKINGGFFRPTKKTRPTVSVKEHRGYRVHCIQNTTININIPFFCMYIIQKNENFDYVFYIPTTQWEENSKYQNYICA